MTTSRPAAATQITVRVIPAMHYKVFYTEFLHATTLPISGPGDWLRLCWLAYPEARHTTLIKHRRMPIYSSKCASI